MGTTRAISAVGELLVCILFCLNDFEQTVKVTKTVHEYEFLF